LRKEATAPDGAIEAISMAKPKEFLLGVQWHPEWRHWEDPIAAMFAARRCGARARQAARAVGHRRSWVKSAWRGPP
jgi:putative glutamine amidotransferase